MIDAAKLAAVENEAGLRWWSAAGSDLNQSVARLSQDPNLAAAVTVLSSAMLARSGPDKPLADSFKDAGSYAASMAAYLLHERVGLTLSAFQAICLHSGMLGRGRARVFLQQLEHRGCAVRTGKSERSSRYRLTDAFLDPWVEHLGESLAAGGVIESSLLDWRKDRAFVRAFGSRHAERWIIASAMDHESPVFLPLLTVMMHPLAGVQIIWALLGSSADGAFPPVTSGPVTISGLANRFGVSRIHVRRIFGAARQHNLAVLGPDSMVRFSADAQEQLRFVWAAQLAQILTAAAIATDDRSDGAQDAT